MDPVELLEKSSAHMAKVLRGVKADQLGGPTPCSEFDVRALLDHVLGGAEMMRAAATEEPAASAAGGGDFAADYEKLRGAMLAAFRAEGAMEKTMNLPFGAMPGAQVVGIAFMEMLVHAWDVAKSTGQDPTLPEDLATACLEMFKPMGAMLRGPGIWGPEVSVDESAPITKRLVAFAGRQP